MSDPCCLVSFIYRPDQPFKGTIWKDYRNPAGVVPTDPSEGYKGLCDRTNGVVYVRRFGNAEAHLYSLLIHELLHILGYDHGQRMQAWEEEVWKHL